MLLKYLVLASIVYFIYRLFSVTKKINEAKRNAQDKQEPEVFTDYEELDD